MQHNRIRLLTVTTLIKRHLATKGIKQTDLAFKSGMTKQMVNHWLKKNDIPTDVLTTWSKVLKHDFYAEMSVELRRNPGIVSEAVTTYGNEKYVALLEQYIDLQRRYDELKMKYEKAVK